MSDVFFFFFSSIIFWEFYFGCGYIIMGKKTESEVGPRYLGETRDSLFLIPPELLLKKVRAQLPGFQKPSL